jgi:hypothetical protein
MRNYSLKIVRDSFMATKILVNSTFDIFKVEFNRMLLIIAIEIILLVLKETVVTKLITHNWEGC